VSRLAGCDASYRELPASEEANWPEAAVDEPRLLDGESYAVMARNLWRLLMTGRTLEEARPIVLARAGVRRLPSQRDPRRLPPS
jgi:hypothetical protein